MRIHDYLDHHADRHPRAEFAAGSEEWITYREAADQSNQIAHALIGSGIEPGDHVALLQKNSLETVLCYHGVFKARAIANPINYRLLPSDWLRVLQSSRAKLIVCDSEFGEDVDSIRDHLTYLRSFIMTAGPTRAGWDNFRQWVSRRADRPTDLDVGVDDRAIQFVTSGTTGPAKVAVLTHGAVTSNIAQLQAVASLRTDDRFLLVLPLCHAAGVITMLQVISAGAGLLIQPDFDPNSVARALAEEKITATMMVPTMIRKCLNEVSDLAARRFDRLRLVIYGASPIDEPTVRRTMDAFGCELAQRYGTTETLSLTWLSPADHRRALSSHPEWLRSAGRALPETQIRIVDTNGQPLPDGQTGEIIVNGPQLMLRNPPSKVAGTGVPDSDWMSTGDIGYRDANGYIYICDRVKDVIISGGETIFPFEVENILMGHPDVEDAAVIGVPDMQWGESVKAIVRLRDTAQCSERQLIEYGRRHLAGYKAPKSIDFVDVLPRNISGKILKRVLREPFWRGHDRHVS